MSESPKSTWGEYALQIAAVASLRSEDPHRKVGACALNHQNMVVGVGYNGLASGKKRRSAILARQGSSSQIYDTRRG